MSLKTFFVNKRDKIITKAEYNYIESPKDAFMFMYYLNASLVLHICAYMLGNKWDE